MSDKIDLISKDIEFVKDTVQGVDRRISNLENSFGKHAEVFVDHVATDKQMYVELHRMNDILQKNTESLSEHMRRTELNEMAINELKEMSKVFHERLVPIEHSEIEKVGIMKFWKKIGMTVGVIASVASVIYTVLSMSKIIH